MLCKISITCSLVVALYSDGAGGGVVGGGSSDVGSGGAVACRR